MSSPGTYSRCWANSTEKPWYGLLCMPDRYPSTTRRACNSRLRTLARMRGSRYLWGSSMEESAFAALLAFVKFIDEFAECVEVANENPVLVDVEEGPSSSAPTVLVPSVEFVQGYFFGNDLDDTL